jgi:hypothetical protein
MNNKTYKYKTNLIKFIRIILNKKAFIIIFIFIVTTLTSIYVYSKTPIYEVISYIKIDYLNKENINLIEQKLKIIYENDILENRLVNSIKQINNSNIFEIKTKATSSIKALNKNQEILQFLQKSYLISLKENEITSKKKTLDKIEDISLIREYIKILEAEIDILKNQESNFNNTKLIDEYVVNSSLIEEKKYLIIAIAFISGAIISIFLAFLLDYIEKQKIRKFIKLLKKEI